MQDLTLTNTERLEILNLITSVVSLYVHGGRDLKEGSIASMWRLNLSRIHQVMEEDSNETNFEWEQVQTTGRGPGKISHHTASVLPSKDVIIYGGLKGEDSNQEIFQFNPNTNSWLNMTFSVSCPHKQLTLLHDLAVNNFFRIELVLASVAA